MDLRYAWRSFGKDPGFTALAMLVMALGIGANTAVFSVVDAVLLKPLAYREPDRIMTLASFWQTSGSRGTVSAPDFHDWHDQSRSFSAMAYYGDESTAVSAGKVAEYTAVAEGTPEFFDVFDVRPILGRTGDGVVISYAYWQSHFDGSTDVLGKTVRMFDRSLPIVGVMPAGFSFPGKTAIWMEANKLFPETESRSAHNYRVVGRLKPGVSAAAAQAEMTGIGTRLEQQYPNSNRNKNVSVLPMLESMVSNVKLTLWVLLGAVGMVLLIACANMANLLFARATGRTREIAIRAAVGAGRARIVRQLVVESTLLASLSGVAGLVLAWWGSRALVAAAPADIPRLSETGPDLRVLAFTFGVSLLASLLFGLAPAIQASRVDLNEALKQGGGRAVSSGGANRIRGGLVVAEIALSVVLLSGAGLLIRSFAALQNVPLGFRTDHLLVMDTDVAIPTARKLAFYRSLLADMAGLSGVSAAGATRIVPGNVISNGGYFVDHIPIDRDFGTAMPQAVFSILAPGTLAALGIPLRDGREFSNADSPNAPLVALINESLARKSFAGQDPIGHTILCGYDSTSMKPMTIVGVIGDVHQLGAATAPSPELIMPYDQHPRGSLQILARTSGSPMALSETLRRMVHDRNPDVPVKFTTMDAVLAQNVAAPRFRTLLLGIFAGLAVCLAMAGVYGVMAYVVGQRSAEIGLRMALGATSGNVVGLILRQGLVLAVIGLTLGLAGAFAASRLLSTMLFEIKPADPATYAAVAGVVSLVVLAASYLPAVRATRIDPLAALRQD